MKHIIKIAAAALMLEGCSPDVSQKASQPSPEDSAAHIDGHPATIAANKASVKMLDFSDMRDFERADKGFWTCFTKVESVSCNLGDTYDRSTTDIHQRV